MADCVPAVGETVPSSVPAGTHFDLAFSIPADAFAGIVPTEDILPAFAPFHLELFNHVLIGDPAPIILVYIPLSPLPLRSLSGSKGLLTVGGWRGALTLKTAGSLQKNLPSRRSSNKLSKSTIMSFTLVLSSATSHCAH